MYISLDEKDLKAVKQRWIDLAIREIDALTVMEVENIINNQDTMAMEIDVTVDVPWSNYLENHDSK